MVFDEHVKKYCKDNMLMDLEEVRVCELDPSGQDKD
jgi:hypothetical protein